MGIDIVFPHIVQKHFLIGIVQILLMLDILITLDSEVNVHVLFRSAPSGCAPSLLYGDDCFSFVPKPLQAAFRLARKTDEAGVSVVPAELSVAFSREGGGV